MYSIIYTYYLQMLYFQVYNITVNKYSKFQSELLSTEQIVSDVEGIKAEMDAVRDKIENQVRISRAFWCKSIVTCCLK